MSAPDDGHLTPEEIDVVASMSAEAVDAAMAAMFTRLGLPATVLDGTEG